MLLNVVYCRIIYLEGKVCIMYLKQSKNQSGGVYLSFVHGYRKDGKVKHKTIEKLRYLDDLKRIYDEPIVHFKQVADERNATQNSITKRLK